MGTGVAFRSIVSIEEAHCLGGFVEAHSAAEVFRLEPSPLAPQLARQRVRDFAADLTDGQQEVMVLLTSEVVTNAVQHPRPPGGGKREEIVVRLARTSRLVRVEVIDDDPRPLPQPRLLGDPIEAGMGLGLVADLATQWGSSGAGDGTRKMVWFELVLPAETP
jgi:two-component sensor histidine kinase